MAGIKEAYERKASESDEGIIKATGTIKEDEETINYMIIELVEDCVYDTIYDYHSDINFEENLKAGDVVVLEILDEHTAKWGKKKK